MHINLKKYLIGYNYLINNLCGKRIISLIKIILNIVLLVVLL